MLRDLSRNYHDTLIFNTIAIQGCPRLPFPYNSYRSVSCRSRESTDRVVGHSLWYRAKKIVLNKDLFWKKKYLRRVPINNIGQTLLSRDEFRLIYVLQFLKAVIFWQKRGNGYIWKAAPRVGLGSLHKSLFAVILEISRILFVFRYWKPIQHHCFSMATSAYYQIMLICLTRR